jgi:hypothetical protein
MDYFMKWPRAYALPGWEALTGEEVLATNFCILEYPGSYIVTWAVTSSLVSYKRFRNDWE